MPATKLAPPRYDRRTITLHWLTAALVVLLWSLGQTIDDFPKGDPRIYARSTHILLGVSLAAVLVARIRWRLTGGTRLAPAGHGVLDKAATLTHLLLYTLLVATVLLGLANAWVRGDNLFNLFKIPSIGTKDLREQVEGWHGLAADALLVLAFLHAAAGLVHHFVLKDRVLQRMAPR